MSQPSLVLQNTENLGDTDASSGSTSPRESTRHRSRRFSACDAIQTTRDISTAAGSDPNTGLISPCTGISERAPTGHAHAMHSIPTIQPVSSSTHPRYLPQGNLSPVRAHDPSSNRTVMPAVPEYPTTDRAIPSTETDAIPRNHSKTEGESSSVMRSSHDNLSISNVQAQQSSPSSISISPRRPTLSNLPPAFLNRVGAPRLTPTIITRTPPMPLHLPTLPPPSPSQPSSARPRVPLRSMPALPVHGSADCDVEANHENASIGDSDEEEDGDMDTESNGTREDIGSDDDRGHTTESSQSSFCRQPRARSRTAQQHLLPAVDTSRIDMSFLNHDTPEGRPVLEMETPTTRRPDDYFSPKLDRHASSNRSPTRTLRPEDTLHSIMGTPSAAPVSTPQIPKRAPSMSRQASRSMVDLSLPLEFMTDLATVSEDKQVSVNGKGKARESPEGDPRSITIKPPIRGSEDPDHRSPRRMHSMPSFRPSSRPPPYATFPPLFRSKNAIIMPREDEGRERLPPYTNSIYLSAMMPRKMEFTAPGVQAKDRKWRRVLCVLEGTVFKIHECPRTAVHVGAFGRWWEKKVGVKDISTLSSADPPDGVAKAEGRSRRRLEPPTKLGLDEDTNGQRRVETVQVERSRTSSTTLDQPKRSQTASFFGPSRRKDPSVRTHSRSHSDLGLGVIHQPSPSSSSTTQPSSQRTQRNSSASNPSNLSIAISHTTSIGSASSSSSSPSRFTLDSRSSGRCTPDPGDGGLIRAYSMQNAESGLGNDYLKRKNVIRVRLEGEQFLLQAVDISSVVEWIEVRV